MSAPTAKASTTRVKGIYAHFDLFLTGVDRLKHALRVHAAALAE